MRSTVSGGDWPNMGGSSITGVSGESGCVRSTTRIDPRFRWVTSWASSSAGLLMRWFLRSDGWRWVNKLGKRRLCAPLADIAFKAKGVFGELEVHTVVIRSGRLHLGDDHAQVVALKGIGGGFEKVIEGAHRGHLLDPRAARHGGQVGDARGRVRS